jgi:hypothetical protein
MATHLKRRVAFLLSYEKTLRCLTPVRFAHSRRQDAKETAQDFDGTPEQLLPTRRESAFIA